MKLQKKKDLGTQIYMIIKVEHEHSVILNIIISFNFNEKYVLVLS